MKKNYLYTLLTILIIAAAPLIIPLPSLTDQVTDNSGANWVPKETKLLNKQSFNTGLQLVKQSFHLTFEDIKSLGKPPVDSFKVKLRAFNPKQKAWLLLGNKCVQIDELSVKQGKNNTASLAVHFVLYAEKNSVLWLRLECPRHIVKQLKNKLLYRNDGIEILLNPHERKSKAVPKNYPLF